jgi:hypothetical protein
VGWVYVTYGGMDASSRGRALTRVKLEVGLGSWLGSRRLSQKKARGMERNKGSG